MSKLVQDTLFSHDCSQDRLIVLNLHGYEEPASAIIDSLVPQVLVNSLSVHIEARDFSPEMEKAPQLIGCGAW